VIPLQGPDLAAALADGGDASGGGQGSSQGGDIGDFKFDGGLADIGIIMFAQFAAGGIDDQVYFLAHDAVDDVGPARASSEERDGVKENGFNQGWADVES
jgi:hypothetical protein